jgi:hypothetical protein
MLLMKTLAGVVDESEFRQQTLVSSPLAIYCADGHGRTVGGHRPLEASGCTFVSGAH